MDTTLEEISAMSKDETQRAQAAPNNQSHLTVWLLLLSSGINTALQVAWFWSFTSRNINYDAVSYIGIARHVLRGDVPDSLNGYWSPLISWCIAAVSGFRCNLTLLGRLVTIGSFLFCLLMLYLLTFRLWRSSVLAALAVLWFTTARAVVAFSVYFIGADYLLTAFVLLYFVLLLRCLRQPSSLNWVLLSLPHGAAFLTKAIAMPWLAVSTLLAGVLVGRGNLRKSLMFVCAGIAVPLLVWFSWGSVLQSRYGVFTAGYQLKWNLLDQQTREEADRNSSNLLFLHDTSRSLDSYMVVDNMFPRSPLWSIRPKWRNTIQLILSKERQNLPMALKEVAILVTPGGLLAAILTLLAMRTHVRQPEAQVIGIVIVESAVLVVAYCMLVFDARYVLPLAPLLMAVGVPFVTLTSRTQFVSGRFPRGRMVAAALLVLSTIFFQVYWASPFRTMRKDYQLSCYDAARKLQAIPHCNNLVVIGRGPYQEHGVGWEAGVYASYFAGCKIVAFNSDVPGIEKIEATKRDLLIIGPDAILLFGTRGEMAYERFLAAIHSSHPSLMSEAIVDPTTREIGELLWREDRNR
jgi:4-amino-4-deoxy-L-arabinose transferase-like glycosyltransferase